MPSNKTKISSKLNSILKTAATLGIALAVSQTSSAYFDEGVIIDNEYGNWGAHGGTRIKVIDYNVDGKEDIVLGPDGSGKWYFLRNDGGSFTDVGALITGLYSNWGSAGDRIRVIDYNADGKQDLLIGPDAYGKWYGLKNNGGTFSNQGAVISGQYGNWGASGASRIKVIDYNNDGLDDILLGPDANGKWYFLRNNGGSFTNVGALITGLYSNWGGAGNRIRVMDYDGDGKEDILIGPDAYGKWYGLKNDGGSFSDQGAVITGLYGSWGAYGASRIKVTDYNGDGLDDILLGPDGSGKWYVLRNNSGTFVDLGAIVTGKYANWGGAGERIRIMDYDADGAEDVLIGPDGYGDWYGLNTIGTNPVIPPIPDNISDPELRRCIDQNKQREGVVNDYELTELNCVGNGTSSGPYWIYSLSGIRQLTSLERLAIGGNSISDLSPVANLSNLNWLHLVAPSTYSNTFDNNDIISISGLSQLEFLAIGMKSDDIITSPAFSSGFTNLDKVDIYTPNDNYVSCTLIYTLESRGITVGGNYAVCQP